MRRRFTGALRGIAVLFMVMAAALAMGSSASAQSNPACADLSEFTPATIALLQEQDTDGDNLLSIAELEVVLGSGNQLLVDLQNAGYDGIDISGTCDPGDATDDATDDTTDATDDTTDATDDTTDATDDTTDATDDTTDATDDTTDATDDTTDATDDGTDDGVGELPDTGQGSTGDSGSSTALFLAATSVVVLAGAFILQRRRTA